MKHVLLLCLFAVPVYAQDYGDDWSKDEAWVKQAVSACFESSETFEDKNACVGNAASVCMDENEGGYTTIGMSTCTRYEYQAWDDLLNEEYRDTMDHFKATDEDEAQHFPEFAKRAETLLEAQRAWIAFRDAECASVYAEWGAGSMRNIAGIGCQMHETAERAIDLWAKREEY